MKARLFVLLAMTTVATSIGCSENLHVTTQKGATSPSQSGKAAEPHAAASPASPSAINKIDKIETIEDAEQNGQAEQDSQSAPDPCVRLVADYNKIVKADQAFMEPYIVGEEGIIAKGLAPLYAQLSSSGVKDAVTAYQKTYKDHCAGAAEPCQNAKVLRMGKTLAGQLKRWSSEQDHDFKYPNQGNINVSTFSRAFAGKGKALIERCVWISDLHAGEYASFIGCSVLDMQDGSIIGGKTALDAMSQPGALVTQVSSNVPSPQGMQWGTSGNELVGAYRNLRERCSKSPAFPSAKPMLGFNDLPPEQRKFYQDEWQKRMNGEVPESRREFLKAHGRE